MRGDEQVVDYLNRALKHELAAVNQYWLHYRILDNWGYKDFAKTWRKELIGGPAPASDGCRVPPARASASMTPNATQGASPREINAPKRQ